MVLRQQIRTQEIVNPVLAMARTVGLRTVSVADPDLELRGWGGGGGGGGLDLLALAAIFSSVISSLPKIRGGRAPRAPPLDRPLSLLKGLM